MTLENPLVLCVFLALFLSYRANEFSNSTGTFPCYYRCLACSGPLPSQCSTCTQNYLMLNGTCSPCAQNCITCATSSTCETCASGFYLSQSTGTCSACAEGAQACTFAAVQSCLSRYFLLNSACFYCVANCLSCSNAYACSLCQAGYYLTPQSACSPCAVTNCSSCASDGSCSLCNSGYYGASCLGTCPAHCDICDQSACYQCAQTYLMGSGGCEAMSLLCSYGASYSVCYQCTEVAFMSGQRCLPYRYVHSSNWQEYYTPLGNPEVFGVVLDYCPSLSLYARTQSNALSWNVSIGPSYKLSISVQILVAQTSSAQTITLSSPSLTSSASFSLLPNSYVNCSGQQIGLGNFQANFTPSFSLSQSSYSLGLTLTNSQGGLVGISELLVEEMPCGVSKCGICVSAVTCQSCLTGYYLENNLCQIQCSQGYYLTVGLQACTLACLSGYYPILADYLCQPCVAPCVTCTSVSVCSSCVAGNYLAG
jgi:hypothetical protein